MSEDAARAFHARLKSDPAFRTAIDAAGSFANASDIIAAAGIGEFTAAELEVVACELSDADLEAVAGGAGDPLVLERAGFRAFDGIQNHQTRAWLP